MKIKKIIILIALFSLLFFSLGFKSAKAYTAEELRIMITQLNQQLEQLQEQLAQIQTQSEPQSSSVWCYDFNVNLKIGDRGSGVYALQVALEKEGISLGTGFAHEKAQSVFGEYTASAVVEFQEKYASEILTPLGLRRGNGFVGALTREKLNKLYSCSVICIQVITPAQNPQTGECRNFPTPCDVPVGWVRVERCPVATYVLTVIKNTAAGGTVTSNPSGINCGTNCPSQSASFSSGISVALTAYPASGYIFTGWSGACSGTSATCVVSMTQDRSVIANFSTITTTYTLSVNSTGASYVPISSKTGHGGTTNYKIPVSSGTSVNLTAPSSVSGYTFTGWSGCTTSSNPTINITMPASNTTCTANYSITTYNLSLSKNTAAGGTVTSNPSGINCGTNCPSQSASFSSGISVALTAYPASGYIFTGWSGACSGTSATCVVSMTTNRSVMANFGQTFTPSITVISPNGGERWEIGKSYPIQWRSNYPVNAVDIYLNCGTNQSLLTSQYPGGRGYYLWTISQNIQPNDYCRIKIGDSSDLKISDISDNNFSIVALSQSTIANLSSLLASIQAIISNLLETLQSL